MPELWEAGHLEIVDKAVEDEIMVMWRSVLDFPKPHWTCLGCGLQCRCRRPVEPHVRCR